MKRYHLMATLAAAALLFSLLAACVLHVSSETHIQIGAIDQISGEKFILDALRHSNAPDTMENRLLEEYLRHSHKKDNLTAKLISSNAYPNNGDEVYTLIFQDYTRNAAFRLIVTNGAYEARDGWQLRINDDSISFDLWAPNNAFVYRHLIVLIGDMWDVQALNYDTLAENNLVLVEILHGEVLWIEADPAPTQVPANRDPRYV